MPKVSLVLTTYNRPKQLATTLMSFHEQSYRDYEVLVVDDGTDEETPKICERAAEILPSLRYFKRVREPGTFYSNPAIPNNIGLRRAQGEITILQNAECAHISPEVIKTFADNLKKGEALFAMVAALKEDKSLDQWYTHPNFRAEPWFFCGALHTEVFHELRGFDERFKYYGFDDVDFQDRMLMHGIAFEYSKNILVYHQYHGPSFRPEDTQRNLTNHLLYQSIVADRKAGKSGKVANPSGWGELSLDK